MKTYKAKELADMAGVTVRTLHHYDAIGLLTPAHTGENGYRYYGRAELERLQNILIYRALGVPLADIGVLLDGGAGKRRSILVRQRARLEDEMNRFAELITTIDRTIADLEGVERMSDKELYKGLSPKKQAEYESWLIAKGGGEMALKVEKAKKAQAERGADGETAAQAELEAIERGLAAEMKAGKQPDDVSLSALLERFRLWVGQMWGQPCSPSAFGGLGDLHASHPDFVARYEAIAPGFSDWHIAAMKAHAARGLENA